MGRIHDVFLNVQPVARMPDRVRSQIVVRLEIGVVYGKPRFSIGGTQVGEHQPAIFPHGIGTVAERVLQPGLRRLARCVENGAVDVEQPAVVAAA